MQILFGNTNRKEIIEWHQNGLEVGTLISLNKKAIQRVITPYALDNGAFGYFLNNQPFDGEEFLCHLDKWMSQKRHRPDWIVVPDVIGNKVKTLKNWDKWIKILKVYQIPLAIAVQDGMTKSDIPKNADVIFVGGSTNWKVTTIPYWCAHFPKVHVGRVNGWNRLWQCYLAGAKSIDGTGFFRGGLKGYQRINIQLFLLWQSSKINKTWQEVWALNPSQRHALLNQILGILPDYKSLPLFDIKNHQNDRTVSLSKDVI